MDTYYDFLKGKQKAVIKSGFDIPVKSLNASAFDWQKSVVQWAVKQGRAALFEDCGLGKTLQELMWAEQIQKYTSSPVLILAPLAVSLQTNREGKKFGIECNIAETAADIVNGINITNYEKLDKFDCTVFSGIILDESSILKNYTGKTKQELINSFADTPYKLAATATPAPNDLMELLNHAEFLGIMRSSEALAIWFLADQEESGKYRLKKHAEADFWKWVASWAVCIETPADIGYDDSRYILPELNEYDIIVDTNELSDNFDEGFFRNVDMSATGYIAEKRRSLKARCEAAAREAKKFTDNGEQVAVWCDLNSEADELKRIIPGAVEIRGSDKTSAKEQASVDFITGKIPVLISKPSIFGYGLNFQNCRNTIFCGMDYSFENYYQAIRRFYRFGQEKSVNVARVIGSTEKNILERINAKARQKNEMAVSMAKAMKEIQMENLKGHEFILDLNNKTAEIPQWLRSVV